MAKPSKLPADDPSGKKGYQDEDGNWKPGAGAGKKKSSK